MVPIIPCIGKHHISDTIRISNTELLLNKMETHQHRNQSCQFSLCLYLGGSLCGPQANFIVKLKTSRKIVWWDIESKRINSLRYFINPKWSLLAVPPLPLADILLNPKYRSLPPRSYSQKPAQCCPACPLLSSKALELENVFFQKGTVPSCETLE